MKRKVVTTYEELVGTHYGRQDRCAREPATAEELFAGYYGRAAPAKGGAARGAPGAPAAPVARALGRDDGELLPQRRRRRSGVAPVPGVSAPQSLGTRADRAVAPVAPVAPVTPSYDAVNPAREVEVDLAPEAPAPARTEPAFKAAPQPPPAPPPPSAPAPTPPAEDDIAADLQAILSGRKVYDPASGRTVERGAVSAPGGPATPPGPPPAPAPPPPPPPAPPSESQAIFDRIAQSMQYANAFDLGTVDLQNRFADFDRLEDLKRRADDERRAATTRAVTTTAKPDTKEFLEDLDAIRTGGAAPVAPPATPDELAADLSLAGDISEALYDTGEHVLAAEALYPDQLVVGAAPGVRFSYGQVIAMADLFESVTQMNAAVPAELQKVKALIERSTAYYKGGKKGRDVSHEDWEAATAGRYLKLAEDNYDHFAPNVLFRGAPFTKTPSRHGDHRTAWERHHKWALDEARKDARIGAEDGYLPQWPLLINAFGDHFLTDAFAAGHIVNKEAVVDYFKATFYSGGKLTGDAQAFFGKVAGKAFTGDVAKKFSDLETYEPHDAWWNVVNWNPNIDSADRFAALLRAIAEREPERIGNLAIKALHDRLNRDGIEVDNRAGSGPWRLTGDGHLTPQTLGIMRQAVQQSAANVLDPGVRGASFAFADFAARVWQYVPFLTPASEEAVKALTRTYVDPTSAVLVDAAAALIRAEADTMIKVLIARKALKKA